MGGELSNGDREHSIWTVTEREGSPELVPVRPPKHLESSGSPVIEKSHEYVMPKRDG